MYKTSELESEISKKDKYKYLYFHYDEKILREKIQPAYLQILLDFDKICKDNHIFYLITAGTLLGAVRENGWIPWDDDIDVLVRHDDFKKLDKAIKESGMEDEYRYIYPEKTSVVTVDGKFMSKKISLGNLMGDKEIGHPLYLDVLPIENVPNNKIFRSIKSFFSKLITLSYNSLRCLKEYDELLDIMSMDSKRLKHNLQIRRIVSIPTRILGKNRTFRLLQYINSYSSEKTKYVSVPLGVKMYNGEIVSREVFAKSVLISFEGHFFPAPIRFKDYLSNRYGDDYMIPPPKKEQGIKCFQRRDDWKQIYLNK
jgi:lipopolysaccharide cholinephosphotransferase